MGRKDKYTVDYFPHNCNHGKTIFILESRFGNDGYAVWFKTLELIGASNNHFVDNRNASDWEFMSAKMQVEPDRLQQIYDLLASLNAIDSDLWEHKIIRSQNFIDNLNDVYLRRHSKCMNKSDLCKHLSIKCKQKTANEGIDVSRNTQTKLNYTKLNYTKLKETKKKYGIYKNVKNVEKRTLLEKWLNYRKALKKPIKVEDTLIALIEKFNSEPIEKIERAVNQSIENSWQGLFWDKHQSPSLGTKRTHIDKGSDYEGL